MARLSFGYLCDFRNPPPFLRPWDQFYAEMLDFIVHAENLGFEGIWLPEHHATEDGFVPSPLPLLGARLGDGYHGKSEGHADYVETLVAAGKTAADARIRDHDLDFFVSRDPDKAWEELAPHMIYNIQTYSKWMHEDQADYDIDMEVMIKPMTIAELRDSGRVKILTPKQAIAHFEDMLARCPALEHFMMFIPAGMPPRQFAPYAELFAEEVIPAFA